MKSRMWKNRITYIIAFLFSSAFPLSAQQYSGYAGNIMQTWATWMCFPLDTTSSKRIPSYYYLNNNINSTTNIYVGKKDPGNCTNMERWHTYRMCYKWNISSIPSNATIKSATLDIWCAAASQTSSDVVFSFMPYSLQKWVSDAAAVWTAAAAGTAYSTHTASLSSSQHISANFPGAHTFCRDIAANLPSQAFAVGLYTVDDQIWNTTNLNRYIAPNQNGNAIQSVKLTIEYTIPIAVIVQNGVPGNVGTVKVGGISYPSPQTFNWTSSDPHTLLANTMIIDGTTYTPIGWTDKTLNVDISNDSSVTVTPIQSTTYEAKYAVTSVTVTVDQKLSTSLTVDSIGLWESGSDFTHYKAPKPLVLSTVIPQYLLAKQDTISGEKYNIWTKNYLNESDVINHHTFSISPSSNNLTALLKPVARYCNIKVDLLEASGNYSGSIQFKDPWLIDSLDGLHNNKPLNRGMNALFKEKSSPFVPDISTNYNGDVYKGVFLNQDYNIPNNPYYSVRAIDTQEFNSIDAYFFKWSCSNATVQDLFNLETPVAFLSANATATALYKGHLASNLGSPTNGNGQQRIVSTRKYVGWNEIFEDVMVYESGGEIWVTTRTWGSNTWSREIRLSDGLGGNSDPSIASRGLCIKRGLETEQLFGDGIYVVWQKKNPDNTYDVHFAIRNSEEISGSFFLGWTSVCPVTGLRYKVNSTACTVPPKPVISIHQTLTDFSPIREYIPIVYRQNATTVNRQYTIIRSNSIFDGYFSPPGALSVTYPPENQTPGSQEASFCFSQPHITGDGINTLPLAYVDFDNNNYSYSLKTINCTNSGSQGDCVWGAPVTVPASDGRALFHDPYSWIGNYVSTSSISHPQVIKRFGKECYAWLEVQSYENPFVPFLVYQERNTDGSWDPNIYVWNLLDLLNMNSFPSSVTMGISPGFASGFTTSLLWSMNNSVYQTTKSEIEGWQTSTLISNGYDAQTTYLGQYNAFGGFTIPTLSFYTEQNSLYRKLKVLDEEATLRLIKPDGRQEGKITKQSALPMHSLYTRTLTVKDTSQGTELSITVTQPRLGKRNLEFTAVEEIATGITAENFLDLLSTLPATVSETDDTLSFGVQIRQTNFKSVIPALTCSFGNPGMLQKGTSPASITLENNSEASRHILNIPMKEYRGVSIKTMFSGIDFKALGNDLQFSLMHTYNLQKGDGIQSDQSTEKETVLPASISLLNNYPNPFNPSTTIKYEIPKSAQITLKVFDVLGREVSTLVEGMVEAGYHTAIFDASNLASGIYFARLTVKSDLGEPIMITKKMLFTK